MTAYRQGIAFKSIYYIEIDGIGVTPDAPRGGVFTPLTRFFARLAGPCELLAGPCGRPARFFALLIKFYAWLAGPCELLAGPCEQLARSCAWLAGPCERRRKLYERLKNERGQRTGEG
ncbi:hypothetical protein [Treponema endosymbiont of Eucomonympha sp.]|uniref:hypothetical protein n=1 Tax=Treponema endosymbiont of Eucomonympha sp. TaxID=1580831 RepID=UPI000AFC92E0|nr:hypothetical protein [Treponema endosymbiont of Eucomonympha sp.]